MVMLSAPGTYLSIVTIIDCTQATTYGTRNEHEVSSSLPRATRATQYFGFTFSRIQVL